MHKFVTGATLIGATLAGAAAAMQAPPGDGASLPAQYRAYLAAPTLTLRDVPPPPPAGSAGASADRAAFTAARALQGSPRWTMATADAGRGVLKAFSCAAGVALTDQNASAVVTLLSRYRTDLITATRVTAGVATPRPYETGRGTVCLSDKALDNAAKAPLLQAAWGWSVALILTEALPQRASALMNRGRAYGESAAICGFASPSEVAAGRDLAAGLLARARAEPEFARDLAAIRAQLGALATTPESVPADCQAESAALASGG